MSSVPNNVFKYFYGTVADENNNAVPILVPTYSYKEYLLKTRCNPNTGKYIFDDNIYMNMLNRY